MYKLYLFIALLSVVVSCENEDSSSDAYGNFETDKTLISAETAGKILSFDIQEGDLLKAGDTVAQIDTLDLHYAAQELKANLKALKSRFANIEAQKNVAEQQLQNLILSQKRIHKLFGSGAATQKQLDDIDGAVSVAQKQVEAIGTQSLSLAGNIAALKSKLAAVSNKISKSTIINPLNGTVLAKLAMANEEAAPGKPLYAVGDMSKLKLRVFVSGRQLPGVKIGKSCKVFIDNPEGGIKELPGKIIWISSSAEFTPKTIQTREQRVNLVYAVKILVDNTEGLLKTGMPGEVKF